MIHFGIILSVLTGLIRHKPEVRQKQFLAGTNPTLLFVVVVVVVTTILIFKDKYERQ